MVRIDDHLLGAIPASGYVSDYVEYGCNVTMSPPEYHLAGAISQMAALMGNKVRFPLGGRSFPAHTWIVLIGRAGAARKSTAVSLATSMLDKVARGLRLPQESSREALWITLQAQPTGFIEFSEFAAFLAKAKKEYQQGLLEDFCEMFDSPPSMKRVLTKDVYELHEPSITILGAGVTDVIGEMVRGKDLSGGFLSRLLFVPQTTDVSYVGMVGHAEDNEKNRLIDSLKRLIRKVPYSALDVTWSKDARDVWETYDKDIIESPEIYSPELSGFYGRTGLYAAKIS
ncbi:MAG: hypothetical protein H0U59_02515, partial [Gemmatimonadaceae bacterium]|nr:hypothetical protein [Gemmatimonadaceae bacterium]